MRPLPENLQLLHSPAEIAAAVKRIGAQINEWACEVRSASHTDILAIPVLRGGIFFFADLVREVELSIEIAPVRAWAYETDVNGVPLSEIKLNIEEVPARGRSILLVDDICDSGRTMKALKERFLEVGAQEVRSAVLVRRMLETQVFEPDWIGFSYPGNEWFVGMGMDDSERWRNLPGIYLIGQSSE